ncbi:hypothetical protein KKB18_12210 [bacterium]|nr:hypothetical protein [bacterium]
MTNRITTFIVIIFSLFWVNFSISKDEYPFVYTNTNFIREIIPVVDKDLLYVTTTGGLLIYKISKIEDEDPILLTTLDGMAYNDTTMLAVNDRDNIFIKNNFYSYFVSYQSIINGVNGFEYRPPVEGTYDLKRNEVLDTFIKKEYDYLIPNGGVWNADEWVIDQNGHLWYISGLYLLEYSPDMGDEPPKPYLPPEYKGEPNSAFPFYRILWDDPYLWLTTIGNYIFRFDTSLKDKVDEAWKHFDGDGDIMMNVYEGCRSPVDSSVWFYGYYKIFMYNDNENEVSDINDFLCFGEVEGLPVYRSRALAIDSRGAIWIGSFGGLVRYNIQKNEWKRFIYDKTEIKPSLTNYYVLDLEADNKGRVWVGTQDGIFVTKDDGETFTHIVSENSLPSSTVIKVVSDMEGGIWGGTYSSGIFHIENAGEIPKPPFKKSDMPPSISSNFINDLAIDSENQLWIATDEGLTMKNARNEWFKFDNEGFWRSQEEGWILEDPGKNLPGKRIDLLAIDKNNNIYCGISAGDELLGGIVKIEDGIPYEKEKVSFSFEISFDALAVDSQDRIWVSSYVNGLYCYNNGTWEIKEFPSPYRADNINCIVTPTEDSYFKNSVWFGTRDEGIFVLYEDDSNEIWLHLNEDGIYSSAGWSSSISAFQLKENNIYCIYLHKEYVWIGYSNSGATKINFDKLKEPPVNKTTENKLADDTVYSITVDTQDNVWLGTYGGLSVFKE